MGSCAHILIRMCQKKRLYEIDQNIFAKIHPLALAIKTISFCIN